MRLRPLALVPLVALVLALLLAPPRAGAAAPAPPAGPGGVLALHERLLAALDRGDGDAVAALLAPDAPGRGESDALGGRRAHVFLDGAHPRSARGSEAVERVLRHWPKLWRSDRAGVATSIVARQVECASEDLSYAVLELERTFERGDERATDRLHLTSLVAWRDGEWRIFHLHVSPAGAPLHTRR